MCVKIVIGLLMGVLVAAVARGDEPTDRRRAAFYGVVAGVTTERELRNSEKLGTAKPLKIVPSDKTANLLEYRFGIWKRVLVAISPDHVVNTIDVWPPDRARAQELAKVLKLGKLAPGEWAEIYVNQLPYFGFDVDRYKRYYFPETDVSMFVEAIDGRLYAKMLRFHPPRLIAWHRGMVAANTYEPPREWTQSHGIFGVIPGRTTREQLLANRLWGKPLAEKRTPNGETRMEFRVDGWSRVTAVVQGGVVRTIDARPMPENSATDAIWRSMKLGTLELVSDRTALPIEALIGPELPAGRKLYRPSQAEGVLLLESASPGSSRTEVVRFFSPLSKQRVAVGFREAIPGSTLADELTAIPTWKKPTRRKQEGEVERWEYESDLFLPWRRVTLTIRNGRVATIDLIPAFQVTPERLSGSLGPLVSRFGLPGKQAFAAEGPAVPSSWHPAESLTYLIVVFSEGETSAKGSVRSVRLYGVRTAFLGTSTRSLTEQEINTLPVDSGLRVLAVWPQSAAAQARIESGDVFVTFDGHPLGSGLDLFRLVQPAPIGSNHDIEVLRRDDRLTVTVTLQPQTPSARYYQAAATSARAGRFELAEVLSGKALELHPKAPMVLLLRAACRRELSDYSNALADVDRLLALDPNSEPAYIERAKINTKLNKLDAALADANAAIRLTGASTPYATRAFVLMTQGRLDEALVDANRAVAKDAKSAFALLCRGKIHRRRNDLESALKDLEQACKLDPIDFDANVWRGGMLFDLKRLDEAIGIWKSVSRRYPDHPRTAIVHLNIASALASQGRLELALQEAERAVELSPLFPPATELKDKLEKAIAEKSK